ncbi:hypothetical protein QVD17_01115 [Tagetes erecta]|uniref:PGG domain-containing protein n=1 Tax=Tagetes erecta TaxID=13708 RepID=A0AAD8L710_TARER|nr:hypothetical protein QVD17_01115 [Tagetes erecta]
MSYNYIISDLPIYKAALLDDWDSVSDTFDQNPDLMTQPISYWWDTPLSIAVLTNRSNRFVKELVARIVAAGARDRLFVRDFMGNNTLHYAAKVGNTYAARLLVEQNRDMTRVPTMNPFGYTPLSLAALHGNKETLTYLLTVTSELRPGDQGMISPYTGYVGGDLITLTLMAGFYDVALEIAGMHPHIVLEKDRIGQTVFDVLSFRHDVFPKGSRLGFWGRCIYSLMSINNGEGANVIKILLNKFSAGFWSVLQYAPTIKNIHDIKVNDYCRSLLIKLTCKAVIETGDHDRAWYIFGPALTRAVHCGTTDLIEECILTYPHLLTYNVGGFCFLHSVIAQRQERVYNLVNKMFGQTIFAAQQFDAVKGETALHIAAKLAPHHRLIVSTGAALQMRRELQWYQEIQKLMIPSLKEVFNRDEKTARMIFTDAHKELHAEGKEWMKNTASSCTVVAALIVTMAFAAIFTAPGGNQDDGKPLFINQKTFMLFIVSDAIALFSSSTSVLMFLGILTSGFAETEFLESLPNRLTIGLVSLFMSIAATMIAFSSVVALTLQGKVTWIAAPLVIATSIPVCLFGLLQFPLVVELVKSTYGRSIFHHQNARMVR